MVRETNFQPTMADHLAAYRAYFRRSLVARRFFGIVAAATGCVAIVGAAITWDEPSPSVRLTVVGLMCVGLVAFMLAMAALNYALLPRRARRLFRQYRVLQRDFRFAWGEDGIHFSAGHGRTDMAWHDYHGWYDGRGVMLLMLSDGLFHFIPHRVLTADQLADLRILARRAGEPAPATPPVA